jgi:hypothetical protein
MSSLQQRFVDRFSQLHVEFALDPDGSIRVPAKHSAVGDLLVTFDGGEITVFIGEITHSHFTPGACGNISSTDPDGEAVACAAEFIQEVLSDRWVLWSNRAGVGGSFRRDQPIDTPTPDAAVFVWSGPVTGEGAA